MTMNILRKYHRSVEWARIFVSLPRPLSLTEIDVARVLRQVAATVVDGCSLEPHW